MPASLYRPEYCQLAIEAGKLGHSRAKIALEFGVSSKTVKNWEADHPEFGEAMEMSRTYAQAYWEDVGATGIMMGKQFNANVWKTVMECRFSEYQPIKRTEISGPGGGPIQQVQELTDAELAQRLADTEREIKRVRAELDAASARSARTSAHTDF